MKFELLVLGDSLNNISLWMSPGSRVLFLKTCLGFKRWPFITYDHRNKWYV